MAPSPLLPQWYESAIFYPGGSSLATSNFSIHISTHRFLFRSHKEGFHSEMKFNHTSRLPRFQPDLDLAKFFDFVFSSLPTLLFLPQPHSSSQNKRTLQLGGLSVSLEVPSSYHPQSCSFHLLALSLNSLTALSFSCEPLTSHLWFIQSFYITVSWWLFSQLLI